MPQVVGSLRLPVLAAAPSSPVTGQTYWDSVTKLTNYWDGTKWVGSDLPAGGTVNQVLAKTSGSDYAVGWVTPTSGGITLPLTQHLTFNVDNTYDIGSSILRPRTVYVATSVQVQGSVSIGANLSMTGGTSQRIIADWTSGATQAALQTSVANSSTQFYCLPNGTSRQSGFYAWGDSTTTNAQYCGFIMDSGNNAAKITVGRFGTGGYANLIVNTGGSDSMYVWSTGKVDILKGNLNVTGDIQMNGPGYRMGFDSGNFNQSIQGAGNTMYLDANTGGWIWRDSSAGHPARMSLTAGGNLTVTGFLGVSAGAGITGRLQTVAPDSTWISDSGGSQGGLEIQTSSGGGAAKIAFHRAGYYAAYFGLDADSMWRVGGWSMGSASYKLMLGDGWASNGASFGVNGANVGSYGVTFSNHGNLYSGIYYSTTGQFVTWPSEGRLKANITATSGLLPALTNPKLRGIEYNAREPEWLPNVNPKMPLTLRWKGVRHEKTRGFKAEDWEAAFPDLIVGGPGDVKAFNVAGMIPITWEAVREVYAEVLVLRERVAQLEAA